MDISRFGEFAILAQSRTFLDAAELLFMSQSTLSKHIMAMEHELGKTRRTGGHLDHDLSFAGGIHGQIAFGVIGAGYLGQKLFAERLVMKDVLVEPVGICIDNHWLEPPFILLKTF